MFDINSLNEKQKIALLYGIIAGDGCLSKYKIRRRSLCHALTLTGSLDDDLPFFTEVVHPLLIHFRGKDTNIKFRKDCRAIEFNFTDRKLFDLLHSYGFPIGKKGQKLIIPEVFYKENLIKYIAQGFMATDGSLVLTKNPNKFYPRVESVVIHKDFLKQIYDYLTSIGLRGAYYLAKSKHNPKWLFPQEKYRFQFNGKDNLLLFGELVGFVNPKHKRKYEKFLEYNKNYNQAIKNISLANQIIVRTQINSEFVKIMAAPGVEPGTSCS